MGTSSRSTSKFRKWLLQSPPAEWTLNSLRELTIGALMQGPIPQHVAFVMDGNRRFARMNRLETVEGHNLGFEALAKVLEVCYRTGVKCVTVYAFSIENFKRSKYEVDALMEMARLKLSQLAQHGELLDRYGASIRVLGQRSLVRPDVLAAIDKAVSMTAHNKQAVLNICFPYTSRDEIATAIRDTVTDYSTPLTRQPPSKRHFSQSSISHNIRSRKPSTVREESSSRSPSTVSEDEGGEDEEAHSTAIGNIITDGPEKSHISVNADEDSSISSTTLDQSQNSEASSPLSSPPLTSHPSPRYTAAKAGNPAENYPDPESITVETLNAHMFTAHCPPLDILVRTSGVERLSDFLLWQCHEHTSIKFIDCLWPEFDLWRFLPVLVEWQWSTMRQSGMWNHVFGGAGSSTQQQSASTAAAATSPTR